MTHLLGPLALILVFALVGNSRNRDATSSRRKKTPAHRPIPADFDAAAYGLVPRESLDARRAGPPSPERVREASQTLANAAWSGDWRSVAAYIGAAGGDWDEHWSRFELLRAVAREDDAWLTTWREADPGNCDAAALEADLMVHRAWEVRGSGYANQVPAENMAKFRALLPAAIEAAQRAALLAPENPAPWVVMVTAARGAQYGPDRFRPLWDGLVARAPHHFEGHGQALQYWCAKWFGSDREMMAFAKRAMDSAPAGSPLAGLYLYALSELEERRVVLPSDRAAKRRLTAVAEALALVPDDHDGLPGLRHLLAHYLGAAGMYGAALEQFRIIGPWCGAQVWAERGDPVEVFHRARARAVLESKAEPLPVELQAAKNPDAVHHHH
ncbi:hypothetical protein [Kitasatospora sp. NPDC059571]|uniref:hypothetical protein n=1 Tax=Kitasatospora sp. NPDC059571 TaxID=3346871 RepID=UPI0036770909